MTAVEPWKLHRWREAFALPWLVLVVAVADFANRRKSRCLFTI